MSKHMEWKDPSNRICLVRELNRFAFRLFQQVCEDRSTNLSLSPSSVSTALAMTFAGAGGQTKEEMAAVLGYSLSEDKMHGAFRQLSEEARTGNIEFRVANRLWGERSYNFLADFLQTTQDDYGAELGQVDFKSDAEAARGEINAWVEKQTSSRIKDLVPQGCLDEMSRLVLTNAVYFSGLWDLPFKVEDTQDSDFFDVEGNISTVPLMHRSDWFQYGEADTFKVLQIPYRSHGIETIAVEMDGVESEQPQDIREQGSDFALIVILPDARNGIDEIVRKIAMDGVQCMPRCDGREVRLFLPRFQMESAFFLGETLQALGVQRAFSKEVADFSRMSDDPEGLFLSEVVHKAFVDVNEEGTEAAAATAVFAIAAGPPPPPLPPADFRADHPFLFMIRDNATGLIHFLGRYMGPEEN